MTNLEYIIAALTGEIDDGGASWDACVHYNINCPYSDGDKRCHCRNLPEDVEPSREMCVECKAEWLESEVSE